MYAALAGWRKLIYQAANRDQLRARARVRYARNAEIERARGRARRAANPELFRTRSRAWSRRNRVQITAQQRAWRSANLEKARAKHRQNKHRRRARLWAVIGDGYMGRRDKAFALWGGLCAYCGSDRDLSIDHITPLSRGGSNAARNLAPACLRCNSSKGPRSVEQWRPDLAASVRFTALCVALRLSY